MANLLSQFLAGLKSDISRAETMGAKVRVELQTEEGDIVKKTISAAEAKNLDLGRVYNIEFIKPGTDGGTEPPTDEPPDKKEEEDDPLRVAMRDHRAVDIVYTKQNGKTITRRMDPYEVKDGFLWMANHKTADIKSLREDRLHHMAVCPTATYKPKWPVKMGGLD